MRSLIDQKFETDTKPFFRKQITWYVTMYVAPFAVSAYGTLRGTALCLVISVSIIGMTGMFLLETMAMAVEGFKVYFKSGWNYIDVIIVPLYISYSIVTVRFQDEFDNSPDIEALKKILRAAVVMTIALKLTFFQKISVKLGLMQQLMMGVMNAVIPFLVIYLSWVTIFALIAATLGANASLADGFTGITPVVGYFLTTFENSLGNINSPTIDFWKHKVEITILEQLCVYLIYIFWWMAQILLLVVLLNFVIALISQYYEDVMNSKIMHTYMMRNQLNHEYYVYNQFLVRMGWRKDEPIDALILIDGEQVESETEWKGLTQTMKKAVVKELGEMTNDIKRHTNQEVKLVNDKVDLKVQLLREDIVSTNNKVELINNKVELVREDIISTNNKVELVRVDINNVREEMNAQLVEIKSLIQNLSKSE